MRFTVTARYLSFIWATVLAFLMLLPSASFPESSLLSYDKLAHLFVFALLAFLLCYGWTKLENNKRINSYIMPLTTCIVFGSLLESLQTFVPGRMLDVYDFIANFTGGLVGVIIFSIFIRQKFVINKLML